jgi:hypothetical protein
MSLSVLRDGYVLKHEAGKYDIIHVRLLPDESVAFYGFLWRQREIVLTGMSKTTHKGKPMWYSEGDLVVKFGDVPSDLETKVQVVAQRRLWKHLGSRSIGVWEVLILMAGGFGVGSFLLSLIAAWQSGGGAA